MELLRVLADTDVVGLEIAVGDAFVFEEFEEVEKIVTEALEELAREASIFAEAGGKGAVAGALHEEGVEAVEGEEVAFWSDDEFVAKPFQEFELVAQAAIVFGFEGNLQHQFLFIASHQKGGGRSAGAEAGGDLEVAGEDFADGGL